MNKTDKQQRKAWLEVMEAKGGRLFSVPTLGATVVIVPCVGDNSEFARVSVALCDFKDDEFKRKRGEFIALERMFIKGESIPVMFNFRTFDEIAEATMQTITG